MDTKKKVTKRLKSATRYPRNNSTYVVAFALHETYDELAAPQNVCQKDSKNSESINSSPDSDSGSYEFNPPLRLNQGENSGGNTATNVFEQRSNYYDVQGIVENQKGDSNPLDQPEVIFSAQLKRHKNKKHRNNIKLTKVSHKKGVFDIRNTSFKCKNNKANVINKMRKFYRRAKKNSASDNLKFCTNSITNIVSKTRILKKVFATENLLETDSLFEGTELKQDGSIRSSVSTVKDFLSSSQNTLVQNSSIKSDDDNIKAQSEPDVVESVINMSKENSFPFKTDVLNVAIAVTYNPSVNESKTNQTSEEKIESDVLTSSPLTAQSSGCLTSNLGCGSSNEQTNSDLTLTRSDNGQPQYPETDSDVFLFAESNSISKTIFIPDLAPQDSVEITNNPTFHKIPDEKKPSKKQTLLDTVINLGIYSDLNSSDSAQDLNINDQIIEGGIDDDDTADGNFKNMGDHQYLTERKSPIGILQKPVIKENTISVQRNIDLHSEDVIRNILMDRENLRKKSCSSDIGTHPTTISELWDRIVVRLDLTVKRLEDSLAERVVKELMKSSPAFSTVTRPIPDLQPIEEAVSAKPLPLTNGEIRITANESVQCDLVKKQMIDNIMLKLSIQNTKPKCYPSTSKIPLKVKKPKDSNDFVEVLKPPAVEVDVEKGETVTISTDCTPLEEPVEYDRLKRLKSVLYVPVAFVRENIVIIASVTNFVALLMCVYIFFLIILKV